MVNRLCGELEIPVPNQALALAGDAYYMLSKAWDEVASHIEDFNNVANVHLDILVLFERLEPSEGACAHFCLL